MKKNIHALALSLLLLAVAAWGGVWYAGSYILNEAGRRASSASVADQQVDKVAFAQRVKALATDTKSDRDTLDALMSNDVVSIVNVIESVGKNAGVSTHVNDALPLGDAQALPDGSSVRSVAFVVESQGSYASLVRLLDAFEHLNLPSSVEQVELQHMPTEKGKISLWRLSTRIRVLTTSRISS